MGTENEAHFAALADCEFTDGEVFVEGVHSLGGFLFLVAAIVTNVTHYL